MVDGMVARPLRAVVNRNPEQMGEIAAELALGGVAGKLVKGGASIAGDAIVGGGHWVGDALANRVEGTLSRQGLAPNLLPSDSKFWIGADAVSPNALDMFRRTANQGAFADLPVTMDLRTVHRYAEDAGVGLTGIKVKILRDEGLVGRGVTGFAHPNGKTLELYPDAFSSPEELVRTLGHERTHLYQARIFGRPNGSVELNLNERAAYGIEDSFVKYWRLNGGR
ncbi:hypothetical protein LMG26696_00379 [Achromobacter pulmonis]|nr:hypothetical protein LMG26696_00379 [Achromobacter pulmonis]